MTAFKEVTIKVCKRCDAHWYVETKSVTLVDQDRVQLIMMKISYCKLCKNAWDNEQGSIPPYSREPIRRRGR